MKKTIIIIFFLTLLQKTSNAQWVAQLSSDAGNALFSVTFTNADTGYAIGGNTILKTINGGNNWTKKTFGNQYSFLASYFIDNNTGYAVGFNGFVIKTIDGGANWINQDTISTTRFVSIHFPDKNTGYAIGQDNGLNVNLVKTTNGGTNWTTYVNPFPSSINSLYFTDTLTGYAVGSYTTILKTIDGGLNWIYYSQTWAADTYSSVFFTNSNTGYIISINGVVLKTTNAGAKWDTSFIAVGYSMRSIHFPDSNNGYIVCWGDETFKTNNGGITWNAVNKYCPYNFNSVFFTNVNTGYTCGQNGFVYKTINGLDAINEGPIKPNILLAFPNPTTNQTTISYPQLINEGELQIYNTLGQLVYEEKLSKASSQKEINIQSLKAGLYKVIVKEKGIIKGQVSLVKE